MTATRSGVTAKAQSTRSEPEANEAPQTRDPRGGAAEMRGNIDRLLTAAYELAATIADTDEIIQRRADILTAPRIVRGPVAETVRDRRNIVSLSEAARRTGRHPEVLRRWCTEGRIPAMRVGRTWVIGTETVAELIAHSARSRPRLTGSNSA